MEKIATFRCLKLDNTGKGVVNYNNKYYKIPNFLTNEEAEFFINKSDLKEPIKLKKIVKRSKERCNPNCPNFGTCPVCTYRHMDYKTEVDSKEAYVKDIFSKLRDFKYFGIEESKNIDNYKNKAQLFSSLSKAGNITFGYFDPKKKDIYSITECNLIDQRFNQIMPVLNKALTLARITPYESKGKKGILKNISIRFAKNEVMIVLSTNGIDLPHREGIVKALLKAKLNIKNIIQVYSERVGSKFVEKERVLYGQGFMYEEYDHMKFRISAKSFYESNTEGMFKIYMEAIKLAEINPNDIALSTFSSIGVLPMLLSRYATTVYAQESNKDNVQDITSSIKANRINNLNILAKEPNDAFKEFSKGGVDIVFAEPSDEGLSLEYQNNLIKLAPKKLVYISSNPFTLEKDVYDLSLKGYSLKKLKAFDVSPRTSEIYALAILEAKSSLTLVKSEHKKFNNRRDNKLKKNTEEFKKNKLRYIPRADKDMLVLDKYEKSKIRHR